MEMTAGRLRLYEKCISPLQDMASYNRDKHSPPRIFRHGKKKEILNGSGLITMTNRAAKMVALTAFTDQERDYLMQTTIRKPNLLMRACPRCGGDLYRDLLEMDIEYVCLQCGRRAAEQRPRRVITSLDSDDDDWREVA
jgi:hypothetical protein